MKETTPKDITPIKRKGIDMTVKAIHKMFPFIIGYKDDESVDKYESAHYIDLITDLNKLSEYMDVPVNPYWSNELINNPSYQKVYAVWSYLRFPPEYNSKDITEHPGYKLGRNISEKLERLYEYIPEQYKLYYEYNSPYTTDNPPLYPVRLKINGFIMK